MKRLYTSPASICDHLRLAGTCRLALTAISLVPRRSLLPRCPREVWEKAVESLSVMSQLTVESRIDRAENVLGQGWTAMIVGERWLIIVLLLFYPPVTPTVTFMRQKDRQSSVQRSESFVRSSIPPSFQTLTQSRSVTVSCRIITNKKS